MQFSVFWHFYDAGPVFFGGDSEHLDNFDHLVSLEGDSFLAVHFCFFAFEDWAEGEEFGEDAADGPEVDGGRVVFGSQEEVGRAIPDRDNDFVAGEEAGEGFVE